MKWMRSTKPKPYAVSTGEVEFKLLLWDAPDGLKSVTLKPTEPLGLTPRIGEEITVTMSVVAIEREER